MTEQNSKSTKAKKHIYLLGFGLVFLLFDFYIVIFHFNF